MNDNLGFNPVNINKVYQTEGVKLPQKAKTEPVTDTVEITKQKSGKSKRNRILAGLAIATTALVIGISVYKKKKALNSIPPELKELFNSLKEKSGKEYIDDAYSGLVKHMGLDDIAPKSVNLTDNADGIFSITGGYNPLENTIEYSKGFSKRLNKEQQFNMLSHELTHCKQFTQVIRTEGLGVEALAEGIAGNATKKDVFGQDRVSVLAETLGEEGAKEILKEQKEKLIKEILPKLKEAHEKALSLPKFAADSPEGIQAKKYIEAYKDYEGLGLFGCGSDKYKSNLLEEEAYKYGSKMEKLFNTYTLNQPSKLYTRAKDSIQRLKDSLSKKHISEAAN